MTFRLDTRGLQSTLFMELDIHLLPHPPFQPSKLVGSSWSKSTVSYWAQHCAESSPVNLFALVSFFNFQFFPICSGLLPKHQTACPSQTQQILLSGFFDRCSQRCKSMQKRIEPTVHFYQKVQKLYCLWANNWNEGLGWKPRVTIYDLYISHYMTTLMQNSWQQNLCFSHPYTFINKH